MKRLDSKLSLEQKAYLDVFSTVTGALGSGISAFADVIAARNAAKANARMAEAAAQDALARGDTEEVQSQRYYAQVKGSARASMAARGVALDEGSPAAVIAGIDKVAAEDATTIRENAAREATGYRMRAYNARIDAPRFGSAFGTLLTGASSVASKWDAYKAKGITPRWRA
jgi:hypothetical protein